MSPYLLGIDGGTESLRAAIFDLEGELLASAATAYDTVPHTGMGRAGSAGLVEGPRPVRADGCG